MRISDWSSDVCSSDLSGWRAIGSSIPTVWRARTSPARPDTRDFLAAGRGRQRGRSVVSGQHFEQLDLEVQIRIGRNMRADLALAIRSEEHTSELQSLMRSSYAVFCLKKKTHIHITTRPIHCTCRQSNDSHTE